MFFAAGAPGVFCQVLVQLGKQGLYLLGSNSEQDVQDKPWPQLGYCLHQLCDENVH